jgi:hypothetical protein
MGENDEMEKHKTEKSLPKSELVKQKENDFSR